MLNNTVVKKAVKKRVPKVISSEAKELIDNVDVASLFRFVKITGLRKEAAASIEKRIKNCTA